MNFKKKILKDIGISTIIVLMLMIIIGGFLYYNAQPEAGTGGNTGGSVSYTEEEFEKIKDKELTMEEYISVTNIKPDKDTLSIIALFDFMEGISYTKSDMAKYVILGETPQSLPEFVEEMLEDTGAIGGGGLHNLIVDNVKYLVGILLIIVLINKMLKIAFGVVELKQRSFFSIFMYGLLTLFLIFGFGNYEYEDIYINTIQVFENNITATFLDVDKINSMYRLTPTAQVETEVNDSQMNNAEARKSQLDTPINSFKIFYEEIDSYISFRNTPGYNEEGVQVLPAQKSQIVAGSKKQLGFKKIKNRFKNIIGTRIDATENNVLYPNMQNFSGEDYYNIKAHQMAYDRLMKLNQLNLEEVRNRKKALKPIYEKINSGNYTPEFKKQFQKISKTHQTGFEKLWSFMRTDFKLIDWTLDKLIQTFLLYTSTLISLGLAFLLIIARNVALTFLGIVGPIFILGFLDALPILDRDMAIGWVSSLINVLLWTVWIGIILSIQSILFSTITISASASSLSGNPFAIFISTFCYNLIFIFLLMQVPTLKKKITGGSFGELISSTTKSAGGLVAAIAGTIAAGGAGAAGGAIAASGTEGMSATQGATQGMKQSLGMGSNNQGSNGSANSGVGSEGSSVPELTSISGRSESKRQAVGGMGISLGKGIRKAENRIRQEFIYD